MSLADVILSGSVEPPCGLIQSFDATVSTEQREDEDCEEIEVRAANMKDWKSLVTDPGLDEKARDFDIPEYLRSSFRWYSLFDWLIDRCGCHDSMVAIARVIFVWISSHISYQDVWAERDNQNISSLSDPSKNDTLLNEVVESRECVCLGYSALFAAACHRFGLKAEIISGWVKIHKKAGGDRHSWNTVQLPDENAELRWFVVDCGWSRCARDGFNDTFWAVPPAWAIHLFFPDHYEHQHLAIPWCRSRFVDSPAFYPSYHMLQTQYGFQLDFQQTLWNQAMFPIQQHEKKEMSFSVRSLAVKSVTVEVACAASLQDLADYRITGFHVFTARRDTLELSSNQILQRFTVFPPFDFDDYVSSRRPFVMISVYAEMCNDLPTRLGRCGSRRQSFKVMQVYGRFEEPPTHAKHRNSCRDNVGLRRGHEDDVSEDGSIAERVKKRKKSRR